MLNSRPACARTSSADIAMQIPTCFALFRSMFPHFAYVAIHPFVGEQKLAARSGQLRREKMFKTFDGNKSETIDTRLFPLVFNDKRARKHNDDPQIPHDRIQTYCWASIRCVALFLCVGCSWRGASKVFAIKFARTHVRLKITARATRPGLRLRLHSHPESANRKQVACGKCASKTKCAGLMAGTRFFEWTKIKCKSLATPIAELILNFVSTNHECLPLLAIIIFYFNFNLRKLFIIRCTPMNSWMKSPLSFVRRRCDGISHDNWRRNGTGNCVTLPFIEISVSHIWAKMVSIGWMHRTQRRSRTWSHAMCSTYFYAFESPCSGAQFAISDLSGFCGNEPTEFSHICLTC